MKQDFDSVIFFLVPKTCDYQYKLSLNYLALHNVNMKKKIVNDKFVITSISFT